MSRPRFYIPRDCIRGSIALLPPDQIHHLRDVLRLRSGDAVELLDGEGGTYSGIVDTSGGELRIVSLQQHVPPAGRGPALLLGQALLKSDKFEWVLQKATELGVQEVVPVEARYCTARLPQAKVEARLERWCRIVCEAAKQCRRVTVPKIHRPSVLPEFLSLSNSCANAKFLFCEKAPRRWDIGARIEGDAVLCIGPEGGWHPDEVESAVQMGFQTFNLGERILRAETAALAAITLIQFQTTD